MEEKRELERVRERKRLERESREMNIVCGNSKKVTIYIYDIWMADIIFRVLINGLE